MFKPRFGLSLHLISGTPSAEILSALADAGAETLEAYAPMFGNDPAKAVAAIPESFRRRTPVASVHLEFGSADISSLDDGMRARSVDSAIKGINMASALGAHIAVLHASGEPVGPEEREKRKGLARESINAILGKACKASGVRIAVELLPRSCLGNSIEELEELTAGFPEGLIGLCLDSNHLMERHASLPAIIKRAGKRLVSTHISDYDGVDEKHWLPGEGVIDWKAFIAALSAIGYSGPFNYECAFPREIPPLERIARLKEAHERLLSIFHSI